MGHVTKTAVVPYSAERMYQLVNDIESYPDFLPWCTEAAVHNRREDSLTATVALATARIKQTFTTQNTMQPGRRIDVRLVSGPFRYLNGHWTFEDVGENICRIELVMEFEFKNKVLKLALQPVFTQFMNTLVTAFTRRAKQIYG